MTLIKKAYRLYGNFLKSLENYFKDTLKAFVDFNNKLKMHEIVFFDMYIANVYSIHYTMG